MDIIAQRGAVGWVDIDWGKLADDRVIGIESNYRMTGWTPTAALIRRMFGSDKSSYPVLFCCEALPTKRTFSLKEILEKLENQGLSYDPDKRQGVFLNCPVGYQFVGLLILASGHQQIGKMLDQLKWITAEFDSLHT